MRRGRSSPLGMVVLVGLIIGGFFLYLYGPMYWDYYNVKEISRQVAIEWKQNQDLTWAKQSLIGDLKKKKVSYDVEDKSCRLRMVSQRFEINCEWTAYAEYPLIKKTIEKTFTLHTEVKLDGEIEQW